MFISYITISFAAFALLGKPNGAYGEVNYEKAQKMMTDMISNIFISNLDKLSSTFGKIGSAVEGPATDKQVSECQGLLSSMDLCQAKSGNNSATEPAATRSPSTGSTKIRPDNTEEKPSMLSADGRVCNYCGFSGLFCQILYALRGQTKNVPDLPKRFGAKLFSDEVIDGITTVPYKLVDKTHFLNKLGGLMQNALQSTLNKYAPRNRKFPDSLCNTKFGIKSVDKQIESFVFKTGYEKELNQEEE